MDAAVVLSRAADAPGAQALDFRLYRYDLSLPAAAVSVAVFAILTAVHMWRVFHHRAFYFTPFVIGGLCKSHAFLFVSHYHPSANGPLQSRSGR